MRPLYKQYLGAAAAGLFAAAVAVNLYANYLGDSLLAARSKPLLMPLLAITALLFFPEWRPRAEKWLLAAALAFGTAGDVLLLYKGQTFFLLGMAMFLLGHLCYLTLFAFSDSLIALRSFAGIRFFDHTGFVIMLTYITAQVLLSVAIIRWRPLPAGMRNNYKRMPIFVC